MTEQKKERIKTCLLIILIVASLIQIGIHWHEQAQGFPFSLWTWLGFNGKSETSDVGEQKDKYFSPSDITVFINPFTQWITHKDNKYYDAVWNDLKQYYLPYILSHKPEKVFDKGKWIELLNESCTVVNFSFNVPREMFSRFIDIKGSSQAYSSVKSIAIIPQENVNETVNPVCLFDGTNVYMYPVNIDPNALPKQFYRELPEQLRNEEDLFSMSSISQAYPFPDLIEKDLIENPEINVPISINENSFQQMKELVAKIPSVLNTHESDKDVIREKILLDQKDSMMTMQDPNTQTYTFSDTENVFRLDSQGILDYTYLPESNEDSGTITTALKNALAFIESRRHLVGSVDIVLTGFEPERNSKGYTFTFDYQFESSPIFASSVKDGKTVTSHAISITATASRVLNCRWFIRSFEFEAEYKKYSNYFIDLVEEKIVKEGLIPKGELFADIKTGYAFDVSNVSDQTLLPSWLIHTGSSDYVINMSEEGP